ncbi:class I SAM-dependent methyltransferase [Thalassobaculum sp. OXR-137]|uniref:class I SAM-dependent methyltransferase n=1 Tax=Thalassobaculum sp. OXR-137 TaxID=3100173 RepID=UPI002AC946B8|nr:class I SAM-dependent methyltransferase [Thalassobaculum sp. OXR-137]WPZ33065.1 class I SAM-dependent methyltransferase [Thalassobaculum sp. OXR-137]
MANRTLTFDETLYAYLANVGGREPEVGARLRAVTAEMSEAGMQISADQGNVMAFLVELLGVRRAVEVGTFTGYSALRMALALPEGGSLVCCDVSDEFTRIGRPFWEEAGVADRIDLRLAPATETLQAMIDGGEAGTVDLMFIDADKPNYDAYYELGLVLVRTGGLILVDNVLWSGAVVDETDQSDSTRVIRDLNAKILEDERVSMAMLGIGDGLTMVRKR